jgi:hypothetical protein
MTRLSLIQLFYTSVLHGFSVYAKVLGLTSQLSGGFDWGHNSPGLPESSNKARMALGLHSLR